MTITTHTTTETITDEQIGALRDEAGHAGDIAQIHICTVALGQAGATPEEVARCRADCASVIADAEAQ
jgi:hypothetical protein